MRGDPAHRDMYRVNPTVLQAELRNISHCGLKRAIDETRNFTFKDVRSDLEAGYIYKELAHVLLARMGIRRENMQQAGIYEDTDNYCNGVDDAYCNKTDCDKCIFDSKVSKDRIKEGRWVTEDGIQRLVIFGGV